MSRAKALLYAQLFGMALAAGIAIWAIRTLPLVDYLLQVQRRIVQMHVWGIVFYPMLYGVSNVFLLPAGVLAIGSGLFFGLWWGFIINLAGNIGGAAVAFFISRKLGRKWVAQKFFQHRKWALLDEAIGRDGWKIIFLSQVHPLFPTSLLNYLYGVTRIGFGSCMLWIALGQAPGLFLYAYLGTLAQFGIQVWQGRSHPRSLEYWLWIGGLALTFVTTTLLARLAFRLLGKAAEEDKATQTHSSAL
ncbi:MAG: hypothetical protein JWL59_1734 [Chthoniobacteraceae bacterium]|nr:hypothetical protein [Chthoniobacteraceae bacterium]